MRKLSHRSARRYKWYSVAIWMFLWALLWIAGATIFWITERHSWSYFEALYFSISALLVVGYGDLTPKDSASKPFFVLWSLFAVPTITTLISSISKAVGTTYLAEEGWIELFIPTRTKTTEEHVKQGIAGIREEIFSSPPPQAVHGKVLLLSQTLKAVMHNHLVGGSPEYDFEDWEYFLYLMDESDHPLEEEKRTQSRSSLSQRRSWFRRLEEWKDERGVLDWLHPRNPLNMSDPVTQWMLLTLAEKLELELLELKMKYGETM